MQRQLILFAFCVSGICALSLEVMWTRMLGLIFGGTALAITTILTVYMAGLAWGSWWGGRAAMRTTDPLRTYAILEAGIGLWALAVPWLLMPLPAIQRLLAFETQPLSLALSRFVMALLILLPPTWMMGATLPILSRFFANHQEYAARDVGRLYAANTCGALLGCLLTGFFLLPRWGTHKSLLAIAALNVSLALVIAFSFRQRRQQWESIAPEDRAPASQQRPTRGSLKSRQILAFKWIFALTGGLAMICQVAWSRVLSMVIGSSFYAFVLVLACFLLGLALGAWVGAYVIRRIRRPMLATAGLLLCAGISILGGIAIIDRLPLFFVWLLAFGKTFAAQEPGLLFGIKALLVMLVVLLPTLSMGALFPFVLEACFGKREEISVVVGQMYAWNTMGAILGSFAAGFLLVPGLGTQGTLVAAVLAYCLCAGLVLTFCRKDHEAASSWREGSGWCIAGSTLILALLWPPTWEQQRLSLGLFRISQLSGFRSDRPSPWQLHSFEEGRTATVTIEKQGHLVALKVNGKTDASTGADMPTQLLAGLLPLLLHGKVKDALVIGWGSGITVGATLQFPLEQVTAVEIEPAVVRGAKAFAAWNHEPRKDPRLRLLYNDGRNHLATYKTRYDAIISEPSNPWISGVSALFTVEFFRKARARLRAGGIFCQWLQLYELSTENIRILLGTARKVFPHAYLWSPTHQGRDSLLIASVDRSHKGWSLQAIDRVLERWPRVRRELQRAGMQGGHDLLVRLMMGPAALRQLTKGAKQNTDDNSHIELTAPLELLTHYKTQGKLWLRRKSAFGLKQAMRALGVPKGSAETASFQAALVMALLRYGAHQQAHDRMLRLERQHPDAPATQSLVSIYRGLFVPHHKLERCLQLRRRRDAKLQAVRCWEHLGLPPLSGKTLLSWLSLPEASPRRRMLMGFLGFAHGRERAALEALVPLTRHPDWLRRHPGLYYILSKLYQRQSIWPEALWFQRLYRENQRGSQRRQRNDKREP